MAVRVRWVLVAGAVLAASWVAVPGTRLGVAATGYPGGTWSPPDAKYAVVAERNVPVTMSDGATLVADVYRPDAAGPFPVLLTQTPYTASIGLAAAAEEGGPGAYFVQRGYVYVSVDVRGTGRSGGNGEFFGRRDAQDGVELVDWASKLPGVNGDVGLHGCSYLGHTQVYTAALLPRRNPVKAAIPACVSSDPYRDTYFENGIPAPSWEGAGLAAGTLLGPTIEAYMVPKYLDSQAGGPTAYDGTFWDDRDHVDDVDALVRSKVPMLLWNGWQDSGFGGLELWAALQNRSFDRPTYGPVRPGDTTTGRYHLLLGDWTHGGGLDDGVQLQWYETWLKKVDTGLDVDDRATALHVQDRVTGAWTNAGGYPMTTRVRSFDGPGGTVPWGPPEQEGGSFTVDLPDAAGTLAGPGAVVLTLRSTGTDAQVHVELQDVDPDGVVRTVTHGSALASMRELDTDRSWVVRPFLRLTGEAPIVAGEPVEVALALQPTLWTLEDGHGLRLVVSSQPSPTLCLRKMQEITTDPVGCRPRSGVLARLVGTTMTVDRVQVRLPLAGEGELPPTRSGAFDGFTLPLDW